MDVEVFGSPEDLARAAAELMAGAAVRAIDQRRRAALCLAGGSTPLAAYRILGAEPLARRVPWGRVHLFWGDERAVPAGHPDHNYTAGLKALGPPGALPAENLHPIVTRMPPPEAALTYEAQLRSFFAPEGRPAFDLIVLGLGPDGHTASLFPGGTGPDDTDRWVVEAPPPAHLEPRVARITLTMAAINAARRALFLVCGAAKAMVAHRIISEGAACADELPAAGVNPAGGVTWFLDREAAELLATDL